jgi:hypothetical protein
MFNDKAKGSDAVSAGLTANSGHSEGAVGGGVFRVQCLDKDGNVKWQTEEHNLVVSEGLQYMNTQFFKGASYTAALYLGLVTGPGSGTTFAAADTLASKAWTEFTNYAGSRKLVAFGTATTASPSVIASSSASSFTISGAGGVVAGAFLTTVASGTSGVLFSESDFTAPGDRTVVSGDTLNVTYTFSLASA